MPPAPACPPPAPPGFGGTAGKSRTGLLMPRPWSRPPLALSDPRPQGSHSVSAALSGRDRVHRAVAELLRNCLVPTAQAPMVTSPQGPQTITSLMAAPSRWRARKPAGWPLLGPEVCVAVWPARRRAKQPRLCMVLRDRPLLLGLRVAPCGDSGIPHAPWSGGGGKLRALGQSWPRRATCGGHGYRQLSTLTSPRSALLRR